MSKEKDPNQEHRKEKAFDEAFRDLLKPSEHSERIEGLDLSTEESPLSNESLSELLEFGPDDEIPLMKQDDWEKASNEYIPDSVNDREWEEYVSRPPVPPLNREQEARAVSLGLQELRKQRDYTHYLYRHMAKEFHSIYATFPILLQKFFEEVYGKTHEGIGLYIEDMEHLIAGDINKVKAIKQDYRLYQKFEEHRLTILYAILEFYNKK
jgi:hypothetical protein